MKSSLLIAFLILFPAIARPQSGFELHIISRSPEFEQPRSIFAADLDGDGDTDVLSASEDSDKIAWFENLDGNGTFSDPHIISDTADGAISVYATDLDADGDPDVLSASMNDDKIAWYKNTLNEDGGFGPGRTITSQADGAMAVFAADLDGDDDPDVLSASQGDDKVGWYENLGGAEFSARRIITTKAPGFFVYAADLDNDGDNDIVTPRMQVTWFENDGAGTFTPQPGAFGNAILADDIDGDGDQDPLTADYLGSRIAWSENDGAGNFGTPTEITSTVGGLMSLHTADLDGDEDLDLLSASATDNTVAWYENTDGSGAFGERIVLTDAALHAAAVFATDLDGDGDNDVLFASRDDHTVGWFENRLNQTEIEERAHRPDEFQLFRNYPNPFNDATTLEFRIESPGPVSLTIIDQSGRKIVRLVNEALPDGLHRIEFQAATLVSGVYICLLKTETDRATRKMMLMK